MLSNSTLPGQAYLGWPREHLQDFFKDLNGHILFVPFAGVSISYDRYFELTQKAFAEMGIEMRAIHQAPDMEVAVQQAAAIAVGGGNTFHLVKELQDHNLMEPIRRAVRGGKPFTGWSAGSNLACPSLRTTNDMPIVQPSSFETLGLVDFQINPHYTEKTIEGHGGESRGQRLAEFLVANPNMMVVGLPEGSLIRVEDTKYELIGADATRFVHGSKPESMPPGEITQLLIKR